MTSTNPENGLMDNEMTPEFVPGEARNAGSARETTLLISRPPYLIGR